MPQNRIEPERKSYDYNDNCPSWFDILQEKEERRVEINAFGPYSYAKHPELYPHYIPTKKHKTHYCSVCGCSVISDPPIPDDNTEELVCYRCTVKRTPQIPMTKEQRERVSRLMGFPI